MEQNKLQITRRILRIFNLHVRYEPQTFPHLFRRPIRKFYLRLRSRKHQLAASSNASRLHGIQHNLLQNAQTPLRIIQNLLLRPNGHGPFQQTDLRHLKSRRRRTSFRLTNRNLQIKTRLIKDGASWTLIWRLYCWMLRSKILFKSGFSVYDIACRCRKGFLKFRNGRVVKKTVLGSASFN